MDILSRSAYIILNIGCQIKRGIQNDANGFGVKTGKKELPLTAVENTVKGVGCGELVIAGVQFCSY